MGSDILDTVPHLHQWMSCDSLLLSRHKIATILAQLSSSACLYIIGILNYACFPRNPVWQVDTHNTVLRHKLHEEYTSHNYLPSKIQNQGVCYAKNWFSFKKKKKFTVLFPPNPLQSNSRDTVPSKEQGTTTLFSNVSLSFLTSKTCTKHQAAGCLCQEANLLHPWCSSVLPYINHKCSQDWLVWKTAEADCCFSAIRTLTHKYGLLIPTPMSAFDTKQSLASMGTECIHDFLFLLNFAKLWM